MLFKWQKAPGASKVAMSERSCSGDTPSDHRRQLLAVVRLADRLTDRQEFKMWEIFPNEMRLYRQVLDLFEKANDLLSPLVS